MAGGESSLEKSGQGQGETRTVLTAHQLLCTAENPGRCTPIRSTPMDPVPFSPSHIHPHAVMWLTCTLNFY